MSKNIVIGIGNLLFCDDGVGVLAALYLQKNFIFRPELEVLDGGTLGFNLAEYFLEYETVFIVDTISTEDRAGTIYKIPSQKLLGGKSYKKTAHEVEVVHMLEACELYDKKAEVTVFAVVPENIQTPKIGLSETLKSKFDILIQTLIKEIEYLEIKVEKREKYSLEKIEKELKGE